MTVDWKHWTISDLISLILVLGSLIVGAIHLSSRISDVAKQHDETLKQLKENGKIIREIRDTQKEVVNVLRDYPPHRHVGNHIVYPNQLPEVHAKNNNGDDQ
jgi:hypothetical protein